MSIFDTKKLHDLYDRELLKQTDPYEYYIRYIEIKDRIDDGGIQADGSPLFYNAGNREKDPPDLADALRSLRDIFPDHLVSVCSFGEKDHFVFTRKEALVEWGMIADSLKDGYSGLTYFDHDYIYNEKRTAPFYKPDPAYDTFMHVNYIRDVFAADRISMISALSEISDLYVYYDEMETEGKDEKRAYAELVLLHEFMRNGNVRHIEKTAIHINADKLFEETDSLKDENGVNAAPQADHTEDIAERIYEEYYRKNTAPYVQRAYGRLYDKTSYLKGTGEFRVSVVIPSKDNSVMLIKCLDSIFGVTDRDDLTMQVIIVDNGSRQEEKDKITEAIERFNYQNASRSTDSFAGYIYEPMEFDFSRMCNIGAEKAIYPLLMFLNDDIELTGPESIIKLLKYASMKDAGAVGIKLLYPDSSLIQHDGIVDLDCGPSHKLQFHDDSKVWYFGINRFNRNVIAVTGACMVVSREKYFNVSGFNDKMKVGYNDVDICLKLHENGLRNVIINDVFMYHHESVSRGKDSLDDAKYTRLQMERSLLYRDHKWLRSEGDPYYNGRLIKDTLDYQTDVIAECGKRGLSGNVTYLPSEVTEKILRRRSDKHLKYNVESVKTERAINTEDPDQYVIEGWVLKDKRDNSCYLRELLLIPKEYKENGGESSDKHAAIRVSLFPEYRADVKGVFKDARRSSLCGFAAKIPVDSVEKDTEYIPVFEMTSFLTKTRHFSGDCEDSTVKSFIFG
ncbi:MAG: glycosyltransferase [Lachnospiraceae bacterium]|nr:glycosyltransferase [Lachnospiraceae bacterium]